MELSKEARAVQREYINNWRKENPDKVKQYNKNYWERQAKLQQEKKEEQQAK